MVAPLACEWLLRHEPSSFLLAGLAGKSDKILLCSVLILMNIAKNDSLDLQIGLRSWNKFDLLTGCFPGIFLKRSGVFPEEVGQESGVEARQTKIGG
jgi:hypothetical protein